MIGLHNCMTIYHSQLFIIHSIPSTYYLVLCTLFYLFEVNVISRGFRINFFLRCFL